VKLLKKPALATEVKLWEYTNFRIPIDICIRKEDPEKPMHLKPDPVAVEFLRQFGLLFVFVIFGAIHFVGYASFWPRSRRKHSSKHKHDDEPKKRAKETSEN
jgi:hypothetical protein